MADIVLTFAREDQAAGDAVGAALTAAGFDVVADTPPSARSWLAKRAEQSRAVVVLWSRHTSGSPSVLRQAAQARQVGKLVSARLDKAAPPPRMARGLVSVDLQAPDGLDVLLARLTAAGAPPKALTAAKPIAAAPPLSVAKSAKVAAAENADVSEPRKRASAWPWIAGAVLLCAALAGAFLMR
jgi:hypothetical protein